MESKINILLKRYDFDEEILGRIYLQCHNLSHDKFFSTDAAQIFDKHLKSLMYKLSATRYHLYNFIEKEMMSKNIADNNFNSSKYETSEEYDLIFEIEAFMFQVKSSLDILIKLTIPVIGKSYISTNTFKNKGESLIKGVEQFKKKKDSDSIVLNELIELTQSHKKGWLNKAIDFRNELNHYEGITDYHFLPNFINKAETETLNPKFKGNDPLSYLKTIYSNNLIFSQDFIALLIAIKAPPSFRLGQENINNANSKYTNKYGKYIVFNWNMVLS